MEPCPTNFSDQESEKNCLKQVPHDHQYELLVCQGNSKDFFVCKFGIMAKSTKLSIYEKIHFL